MTADAFDVAELLQRIRDAEDELRRTQAANLALRRALGWLLGHHRDVVREATSSALARYGADADPTPVRMRIASVAAFVRHLRRRA